MRIVAAVLGHRVGHFHAVGHTELIVVGAMTRRDMHEACAGIRRHERAGQQAHVEFVALAAQRMGSDQALEISGTDVAQKSGRELGGLGHGA